MADRESDKSADWRDLLSHASSSGAPLSTESLDGEFQLAAQVRVPVLITADNRERREICARLIHASGTNGQGPFVVSCDATGAGGTLGSFVRERARDNGAILRQQFESALGGTLFIDDITRLSQEAQAQLWCLLEEYQSGVRVISGASRHLDVERATGAFCDALFYRLNVVHIDLTPRHAVNGSRTNDTSRS